MVSGADLLVQLPPKAKVRPKEAVVKAGNLAKVKTRQVDPQRATMLKVYAHSVEKLGKIIRMANTANQERLLQLPRTAGKASLKVKPSQRLRRGIDHHRYPREGKPENLKKHMYCGILRN